MEDQAEKIKLGMRLQLCREHTKPKVSQAQAARDLEIERGTLSNLERDERQPSLELLVKLANYYKTTTDFLLGRQTKSLPEGAQEILEYLSSMSPRGRAQLLRVAQILYEDDQEWKQRDDLRSGFKLILGETTLAAIEAELPAMLAESVDNAAIIRRVLDALRQNMGDNGG